MSTLTSLPLSLLSRILSHLCDPKRLRSRATLHMTNDYVPGRHPAVEISLDGVRNVNLPFPTELLAPALASPILAAAAQNLVRGRLSYLTDLNTGASMSCWVDAFSDHVKAIAIVDAGKKWRNGLARDLRKRMEENHCRDAVDLFRTICVNHVKLRVLDVVNVPFDKCGSMEDEMMTGLCTTLETCQSTLQELALPVYLKSDLCTRALATVTLPHLTVFSIELRRRRKLNIITRSQTQRAGWSLLEMIRAVDGHADRQKGMTSLKELRLIDLFGLPCTPKESGCSAGFFRAIKTMRVTVDRSYEQLYAFPIEAMFGSLFRELEYFYCAGSPPWDVSSMLRYCKQLKELHLCHRTLRTGERVDYHLDSVNSCFVRDACCESQGKIRTLVAHDAYAYHVRQIRRSCSNLQHLSLHVTAENMNAFGKFLKRCPRLETLEIIVIAKHSFGGRMGKEEWLEMGRLIPGNAKLRELEIQMSVPYDRRAIPIDVLVDCLVEIIRRIGGSVERLSFRLWAELRTVIQPFDALCRIMDCCADHSRVLTHLDVDIAQGGRGRRYLYMYEIFELLQASDRPRLSMEKLVESQPCLKEIDLGRWHYLLD